MQKVKGKALILRGVFGAGLAILATPLFWAGARVGAQVRDWIQGVEQQGPGNVVTLQGLEAVFNNILVVATGLVGIVLFVMLLLGGVKYITSGGEREAVASARKTITFALLGMILFAAAYLIMRVIERITGVTVTVFRVYRY